jgi:hypothetical protein
MQPSHSVDKKITIKASSEFKSAIFGNFSPEMLENYKEKMYQISTNVIIQHICVYVSMYVRKYVCMCICTYVYMYVYMHARIYLCMYVCACVCVYVCMY